MAANLKRKKDIYHRDQFTVWDQFLSFATFVIPLISRWSLPVKSINVVNIYIFHPRNTSHSNRIESSGFSTPVLFVSLYPIFLSWLPHPTPSLLLLRSRSSPGQPGGDLLIHIFLPSLILSLSFSPFLLIIAGQCRTNPWPAVPDWTLMPEYQCRTEGAYYRKKCRCRTNFCPASCLWTFRVYHFPLPAVWTFTGYPFHNHQNQQCGRAGRTSFSNAGMLDCPASSQSGTGIRGPSPVPECSSTGLRYRKPEFRCRRHRPRCRCPAMLLIPHSVSSPHVSGHGACHTGWGDLHLRSLCSLSPSYLSSSSPPPSFLRVPSLSSPPSEPGLPDGDLLLAYSSHLSSLSFLPPSFLSCLPSPSTLT